MTVRCVTSTWIGMGAIVIAVTLLGCNGSSHASLPSTPASSTQNAPAPGMPGTLAVTLHVSTTQQLTSSTVRSPQYVSGKTQGVYITGTCLTGGGTVTQSCTGAAFPAVYADVSAGSPLCAPAAPPATGQTCILSALPVPGYSYAITVVALDAKPLGEGASGYGTAFATAANALSAGSAPGPLPAATGSPAPAPTPTALGPFVGRGTTNSITIALNAIATAFVRIEPSSPGVAAADNVVTATATGSTSGLSLWFSAGDAAGNLIGAPACTSTYTFSPTMATLVAAPPPGACDNFGGPDAKAYALALTSSLPTHVCVTPNTPPPPSGFTCTSTGTSATSFVTSDFAGVWELEGSWTQNPAGLLGSVFLWDGIADNDACSGASPKCGVPIPFALTNSIPATTMPLVGRTASYSVTNAAAFYLAPFVTTVSCGANASCSAMQSPPGCSTICPQISIDDNGTASVTVYLYAAGGAGNIAGSAGCYAVAGSCFSIATSGAPPANVSPCYSGLNLFSGLSSGSITCAAAPDPAAGIGPPLNLPTGTVDCMEPTSGPNPGSTVAYVFPGTFTKGAVAPPGVADSMTFTIKAIAAGAGFCTFQIQDAFRAPPQYSLPVNVNVSSSNTTITVPTCQPLLPPSGVIAVTPTILSLTQTGQTATLTATEANFCLGFSAVSANPAIAAVSPAGGSAFTVTAGSANGSTTVTVSDGLGDSTPVPVTVTLSNVSITVP